MARSGDPLTLSREDLYELVWSKPMTELAQDFGLSDVALAKRCRKLGVPIPGRGYWARVAAGQTPRQPALRKRADDVMDYTALTFDAPREETPPEATRATTEQHPLFEKVQSLQLTYSDDLRLSSAAVKRTAARLKRPWRSEISWNRGERQGPIISIDVTESCADRALTVSEQTGAVWRERRRACPRGSTERPTAPLNQSFSLYSSLLTGNRIAETGSQQTPRTAKNNSGYVSRRFTTIFASMYEGADV
jgi:hypothetical protein